MEVLALSFGLLNGEAGSTFPELNPAKAWRKNITASEKTFAPVPGNNSIRFGSKTLHFFPNGKIQCISPDGGVLFSGAPAFWLVDGKKTDWYWRNKHFNRAKSKFYREGQKYIWELW